MLPVSESRIIERELATEIISCEPVVGGCIAKASRLRTRGGDYFLKWGRGPEGETFSSEAAGLHALASAGSSLRIPLPLLLRSAENAAPAMLLTEWIEKGPASGAFWVNFGRGLADLHRHTSRQFGWDHDNYIGRLPQHNQWLESWPEFFRDRRLRYQAELARHSGQWKSVWDKPFDRLLARLEAVLPTHPEPSIVHGDLWSGNFMPTTSPTAAVFDPAVYFAHREVDLAMTELFGGFDATFYAAYQEAWPVEPGYDERKEIYNLYHLLSHLNHFGGGYAASVAGVLDRFGT